MTVRELVNKISEKTGVTPLPEEKDMRSSDDGKLGHGSKGSCFDFYGNR